MSGDSPDDPKVLQLGDDDGWEKALDDWESALGRLTSEPPPLVEQAAEPPLGAATTHATTTTPHATTTTPHAPTTATTTTSHAPTTATTTTPHAPTADSATPATTATHAPTATPAAPPEPRTPVVDAALGAPLEGADDAPPRALAPVEELGAADVEDGPSAAPEIEIDAEIDDVASPAGSTVELDLDDLEIELPPAPAPAKAPPAAPPETDAVAPEPQRDPPPSSHATPPPSRARRRALPPDPATPWPDERPVTAHVDEAERERTAARSLEAETEARAVGSRAARVRGLLVAAELAEQAGEPARADALAREACEIDPAHPYARRAARAAATRARDWGALAAALSDELRAGGASAARTEAALFAAVLARWAAGDVELARQRLDEASRLAPEDLRIALERAARVAAEANEVLRARGPALSALFGGPDAAATSMTARAADAFRAAREATGRRDVAAAVASLRELGELPDLDGAARWTASAIAATDRETASAAVALLEPLAAGTRGHLARRALAARALDAGSASAARAALDGAGLDAEERLAVAALAGAPLETVAERFASVGDGPLVAAVGAVLDEHGDAQSRVRWATGAEAATVRLARGLAAGMRGASLRVELDAESPASGAVRRAADRLADARAMAALLSNGETEATRATLDAWTTERAGDAAARAAWARVLELAPTRFAALDATTWGHTADDAIAALRAYVSAGGDARATAALEAVLRGPGGADLGDTAAEGGPAHAALATWSAATRAVVGRPHGALPGGSADPEDVAWAAWASRDGAAITAAVALAPLDVALRDREPLASDLDAAAAARVAYAAALTEAPMPVDRALLAAWTAERAGLADEARTVAARAGDVPLASHVAARIGATTSPHDDALAKLEADATDAATPDERRDAALALAAAAERRGDGDGASRWLQLAHAHDRTARAPLAGLLRVAMQRRRDDELRDAAMRAAAVLPSADALALTRVAAGLAALDGDAASTNAALARAIEAGAPSWALRRATPTRAAFAALAARAETPRDRATLALREAELAAAEGRLSEARALLERSVQLEPDHLPAWVSLADLIEREGAPVEAAQAWERVAGLSAVALHRAEALRRAAALWLGRGEKLRGRAALEQAVALAPGDAASAERLRELYVGAGAQAPLAALLERRLSREADPIVRAGLELERARALFELGDDAQAHAAATAALEHDPRSVAAHRLLADVAERSGAWDEARAALTNLAVLAPATERAALLARRARIELDRLRDAAAARATLEALVALAPDDHDARGTLARLQADLGDTSRAIDTQRALLDASTAPADRRRHAVALARLFTSRGDPRAAEQVLEAARREAPWDAAILAAQVEAMQASGSEAALPALLDRAATDARRALGGSRVDAGALGVLAEIARLRGRHATSRAIDSALAALEGRVVELAGAGLDAADPGLDDALSPEALGGDLRELLLERGAGLDAAAGPSSALVGAVPLRDVDPSLAEEIARLAHGFSVDAEAYVSPRLATACIAASLAPACIVLGRALVLPEHDEARRFLVARALKLVQSGAAPLARLDTARAASVVAGWLEAQARTAVSGAGLDPALVAAARSRATAAMPPPSARMVKVATRVAAARPALGALPIAALAWADRVALLATGSFGGALAGVAAAIGDPLPRGGAERAAWAAQRDEARLLVLFAASDAYATARESLGAD